jgi:hypothetical protein
MQIQLTFRETRSDPKPQIYVGDRVLSDVTALTVRFTGMRDSWLHSWTALTKPPDDAALRRMLALPSPAA